MRGDNGDGSKVMYCKSCGSTNRGKFNGEIAIHLPGQKTSTKPVVWVFPRLVVCLDCGTAEFAVPEAELHELAKGVATRTSAPPYTAVGHQGRREGRKR
jgi:hypothetical protein